MVSYLTDNIDFSGKWHWSKVKIFIFYYLNFFIYGNVTAMNSFIVLIICKILLKNQIRMTFYGCNLKAC